MISPFLLHSHYSAFDGQNEAT